MKTGHSVKKALLTEINMVPFIDVVLVLLIIFMVMSPFLAQSQIPVNLPQAVTNAPTQDDTPLKVQVTKEGAYYIDSRPVPSPNLEDRLRTALNLKPKKVVLVEADKGVDFEFVVRVLDAANQLNAAKVGVAVIQPK